jgi:hypothetical protein
MKNSEVIKITNSDIKVGDVKSEMLQLNVEAMINYSNHY